MTCNINNNIISETILKAQHYSFAFDMETVSESIKKLYTIAKINMHTCIYVFIFILKGIQLHLVWWWFKIYELNE